MRALLVFFFVIGCIALTDLESNVLEALKEAAENINERDKLVKEDTDNVQSQKATNESIIEQRRGDLLMEATKILIDRYGATILPQLEGIDIDKLLAMMSTSS